MCIRRITCNYTLCRQILVGINDRLFIPNSDIDGVSTIKYPKDWNAEETKRASYDLKERDITRFCVKHTNVLLNEGDKDLKESQINMLTDKYELFCMKPGETMEFMQMNFIHSINKLDSLGKILTSHDCTNKVLRLMFME